MTKLNQKSAVYAAIMNTLAERNIGFDDGQDVKPLMSKEVRADVSVILVNGFNNEEIELDKPYADQAKLKAYVSGLISNWVNKDKRLNGGEKHVAKNPGSRVGASDPQLKALRALLSTTTDDSAKSEIQSYIDSRASEIQATLPKAKSIDFSSLPEALRSKYSA